MSRVKFSALAAIVFGLVLIGPGAADASTDGAALPATGGHATCFPPGCW
ncbi:hypothetical protein ACFYO1_34085 [Nocardia sp. NPDC006044]